MRPASSRRAPSTLTAAIPTLAATVTATPRPQPASAPPTQLDRSRRLVQVDGQPLDSRGAATGGSVQDKLLSTL